LAGHKELAAASAVRLAGAAAAAYRAGKFELALSTYRRALPLATSPEDAATLRMNVAACLIELRRLDEASLEFLDVAKSVPSFAQKARLNAALIALELGDVAAAESLLAAASPVAPALVARAADVRRRIAEARDAERPGTLRAHVAAAAVAIKQENWDLAESKLLEAKRLLEHAPTRDRVDVLLGLATVQLAREHPHAAQATLTLAVVEAPNDPEIHYALARAYQALGDAAEARVEYRKALELSLGEPQASLASSQLKALDALAPSSWFAWLLFAGGFDSNPGQSGAAQETALGRREHGGSGYARIATELGRKQRVTTDWWWRARYQGEWLGLGKPSVQDLSLQNHGLWAGLKWTPTDTITWELETGPNATFVGLGSVRPFAWDWAGSLKLRYVPSRGRAWRIGMEVRGIRGLSDWKYLSGTRVDSELSHLWSGTLGNLHLGLHARLLTIGTRRINVDAALIPACINRCDGANYEIPLSYFGVGPVASARAHLVRSLSVVGVTQLDWRRYRDESYIVGIQASRKRRVDRRFNIAAELQWALDAREQVLLVPSYTLLVSGSNVAQTGGDPAHAFDYDDRRFIQHFVELGVEGSF
jgi:Flp pilus assembly protein TadD